MCKCSKQNVMIIWAVMTGVLFTAVSVFSLFYGGKCRQPMLEPNFDRVQYLGRWYEFARSPNYFQKLPCAHTEYVDDGNNYI